MNGRSVKFTISVLGILTAAIALADSPAFAQEMSPDHERRVANILRAVDRNANGKIEQNEAPRRLRDAFDRLDSDQDGAVSRDELAAFVQLVSPERSGPVAEESGIVDPFEIYGKKNGQQTVDRIELATLRDERRDKDLQIRVTWPTGSGPFPVIVFSHGLYGSKDAYLELTEFWAAAGYVVIQPNHADSLALGARLNDPANLQGWPERPADVSFILDSLDVLVNRHPELAEKMDRTSIGVGGHSFGAGTSQLIAGATARRRRRKESFADERVAAALLMSSQGPGGILSEDSWETIRVPIMVMSGSADGPSLSGQPAEWRKQPWELSPPGDDKYLVWIEDLDHGFGNITGSGRYPTVKSHKAYVQATTLAFWDAWLKNSDDARQFLASDQLPRQSGGDVTLKLK